MPNKIPKHDDLMKKEAKWSRINVLMENDEEQYKEEEFCIRLPNERDAAYQDRRDYFPTGFINMTQDLIAAPGNSIFHNGVKFQFEQDDGMLSQFSKNVTLGNDPMPWLRYVEDLFCPHLRAYGTVFTVIDKPRVAVKNRLQEREKGMPYVTNIHPQDVLNYQFVDGDLQWFAYRKAYRKAWLNPLVEEQPKKNDVTCYWDKQNFVMYDDSGKVLPDTSFTHNWGFVPVVVQASFLPKANSILGVSAFEQTSNMIIMANNLIHVGSHDLFKNGGSILLMHGDAISATNQATDELGNTEMKKQDKGTVLTYEGETEPKYLEKQLAVEEAREQGLFYIQAAVENERDLKSVRKSGTGTTATPPQSGIAKLVDREPLADNLISLATDAEVYSDKIFEMVSRILAVENDMVLEFDKDFDLRTVEQKFKEIELAQKNGIRKVTSTGWGEMWHNLVPDITRDVETQAKMNAEIDEAVKNPEEDLSFAEEIGSRIDMIAQNQEHEDEDTI